MPRLLYAAALIAAQLAPPLPASAQTHYIAAPGAAELSAAAAQDVLLVDIRRPEEWRATGVLPEALLLTYEGTDGFLAALAPHLAAGKPLALICRTGNRTSRAASELGQRLDVPVIDIAGGMLRLLAEGTTPSAPTRAQGCTTC